MKKINFLQLLLFFSTIFCVSCKEDDSVVLIEPSHRVIVTSEMDFENTINAGGHIDFGDISQGVESRIWTFPENVSSISGESGNTSSKPVVKGVFNEPGVYNVTLNQIFKGNSVYPEVDSTEPIEASELETTIVVTVLGEVKANMQAFYINDDGSTGAALDLSDNAENEIVASKSIRLTQSSDGVPTNFAWNIDGANPTLVSLSGPDAPDAETDVRLGKLGTWNLQFIPSRTRPTASDTLTISNFIKVIASTEPVELERVFERTQQTSIGLQFSREMDPTSVNKDDFSITIQTANGATLNPAISSVSVDASEGNILIIELENESMYNDDAIMVSYTPGDLSTMDLVKSEPITAVALTDFIKINILESSDYDSSFETTDNDNWRSLGWGGFTDYTSNISLDQSQDGDKSIYIEMAAGGGMIMGHKEAVDPFDFIRFPAEKGPTYEIGIWVYVTDLGSFTATMGNPPDLRFYWNPGTNWGVAGNPTFNEDFETNKWVYTSFQTTFAQAGDLSFMIRGFNATNPSPLKFYMDNITVAKLNLRP